MSRADRPGLARHLQLPGLVSLPLWAPGGPAAPDRLRSATARRLGALLVRRSPLSATDPMAPVPRSGGGVQCADSVSRATPSTGSFSRSPWAPQGEAARRGRGIRFLPAGARQLRTRSSVSTSTFHVKPSPTGRCPGGHEPGRLPGLTRDLQLAAGIPLRFLCRWAPDGLEAPDSGRRLPPAGNFVGADAHHCHPMAPDYSEQGSPGPSVQRRKYRRRSPLWRIHGRRAVFPAGHALTP